MIPRSVSDPVSTRVSSESHLWKLTSSDKEGTCSLRSTSASLPRRRANVSCSFWLQRGRYVAALDGWVIHNFRSYLTIGTSLILLRF